MGDHSLQVVYRLSDGRYVDSVGRTTELDAGRSITRLTRGGSTVAALIHQPGLLDASGAVDEITDSAKLALDNERLHAERRAQLADLRASRARIVTAADAERRRLERDLHDGAQQLLVALSLSVQLARLRLSADADAATPLDGVQIELAEALRELRAIARGVYPRELADEGLSAGLETLAESSPSAIRVTSLVEERLALPIESAAYFAVAQCVTSMEGDQAAVLVTRQGGRLCVEITGHGLPVDLVDLGDRVGALAGTVDVLSVDGIGARIRVELPCES